MTITTRNRPETQTIKTFTSPKSKTMALTSGHMLHLSEPASIGVVRIELFWAAGSFHQNKTYIATLANDLLFSGNDNRTEFEVVEFLDFLGATHRTECGSLGSSVVVRANKKNILTAFAWVVKNIHEANYPEKELETAKLVRSASLERQQKTPKYWSNRLALEHLYGDNSYLGKHGNVEDYSLVNREDLMSFKSAYYSLDKAMIFISGDTDGELLESIEKELQPFREGGSITIDAPTCESLPTPNSGYITKHVDGTNQVSLQLVQHIQPKNQRERFGLTLLNLVLGGYFGSRLMQILREEKGLTYGIGSYFKPAFNDYTWTIAGDLNSDNIEASISTIHDIFSGLKTILLDDSELDKIKQYYSGQFRSGFDGPFSMGGKIQHLMYRGLGEEYYNTVLPGIWSITKEELMSLANNYLHPESFIHVMAGDTPSSE
jgi:predicted Zn-dependent peptidase